MDIYFCDECGTRVTDLDLRAGKGMRKLNDTICPGCVDQGLAGSWLVRAGKAVAAVGGRPQSSASLAVAERPDPIAIARDRARTQPDDPFAVDEPVAIKPLPKPGSETDFTPAQAPAARPKHETPMDGLAAAGGGFGALVGSSMPSPPPGLVDDPEDSAGSADREVEVAEGPPGVQAESPFDFVHPKDNDNPGKAETAEVPAVGKQDEPKPGDEPRTRTPSGRHPSQKRSSTSTSKRTPVKSPSTRRSGSSRARGNKVVMISLGSCAVMLLVFFGFVLPNVNKPRAKAEVIRDEPLSVLQSAIDQAKRDSYAAMGTDDASKVERAIASIRNMQAEFENFRRKAKNWDEDAHGEQLRRMGFNDVLASLRDVNQRKVILENRK